MAAFPLRYAFACALLAGVLLPSLAQGQWVVDGIPVCTATGIQRSPGIVPDGMGGAVVFLDRPARSA